MFGNSDAGLAVNFVGETAGVMGISYFFHRPDTTNSSASSPT